MKGLLIKDFKLIYKHGLSILVIAAFFCLIAVTGNSSLYFAYYSAALISLMPVITMSYDEAYKWNKYEAVLPIKKTAIVLEKYVLVAIIAIPIIVIEATILHFAKDLTIDKTASFAYLTLFISLLSPAIVLPINFRFGYLKGRWINIIVIAAMAGSITALNLRNNIGETALQGQFTPKPDAFLFAIVGCVLIIMSFIISNILYKKREF